MGPVTEISLRNMAERSALTIPRHAVAVAAHYGTMPTAVMLPEAREEQTKLEGLSGSDFNKEFASYMVKERESDISDFEKEASGDAPADVKKLAQDALPNLRKHLAMGKRSTRSL